MKKSLMKNLAIVAASTAMMVLTGRADIVAEWKFDSATAIAEEGTVTLDKAAEKASTQSVLRKKSQVMPDATGLSTSWAAFLQKGYLNVQAGSGESNKNLHGLVTKESAPDAKNGTVASYVGYTGVRFGMGGTVYVVFSPNNDWTAAARRGLFSTGHTLEGLIHLGVTKTGEVIFRVGTKALNVDATTPVKWEPNRWYLAAATWEGEKKSILMVCPLGENPQASVANAVLVESSATCPVLEQPEHDPLCVGAAWINTGGENFTIDGADARIAYVRLDNTYTDRDALKAVLLSLGAAPAK